MNTFTLNNGNQINMPEISDYAAHDKSRATRAAGPMNAIWNTIVNPVYYPDMLDAIQRREPPVSVVASAINSMPQIQSATPSEFDDIKRFAGAVTAYWLSANGARKKVHGSKDLKASVNHPGWNVGQLMTF